jgi:NAD(P)-dependent dehydrogenase (short-subunit alcohol dehydrogenase family)
MDAPLHGRVALVTGASRGLGRAVASALAEAGASLALVARDGPALDRAAAELRAACASPAQQVRCYPADLADPTQVERLVARAAADLGGLDILVNNAAIQGPLGPFEQSDWDAWQRVFQVNFLAPARLTQLAIPLLRAHGGKIVNLSGGGATAPRPHVSGYAAAKCALVRLSETLAEELREARIDVNCVAPGSLNTQMLDELLAAGERLPEFERQRAQHQAASGGTPLDLPAALILFLASPASDGITGRLISAVWDDWPRLAERRELLAPTDIFTLRRIVPSDRGLEWDS